jgi:hypothetical protein
MPNTFIVGYWGCIFLNGEEHETSWRSDNLSAGARVGLLVTELGDLVVFVEGEQVVRVDGAVTNATELFPVVDVFAATKAVTLSRHGLAPLPPFKVSTETPRLEPRSRPRSERSFSQSSYTASAINALPLYKNARLSRSTNASS